MIQRIAVSLTALFTILCTAHLPIAAAFPHNPYANMKPVPSYAKWGRLAMKVTQEKYPNAKIVDYLHVGRASLGGDLVQEKFKLWLKGPSSEWGVFVTIVFHKHTEQVDSVKVQQVDRSISE